jgi:branched-chain amino acid transport system permease protein
LNGLSLGAVYAFIALGYTLVYGIIRLINFAHGEFFMAGAFAGYFSLNYIPVEKLNLPYPLPSILALLLAFFLSALTSATLALIVERFAYRPIRAAGRISALLTALGVSLFLQNLGVQVFSAEVKAYPESRRWAHITDLKEGTVFDCDPYIQFSTRSADGKPDIAKKYIANRGNPLTKKEVESLLQTFMVTNTKPFVTAPTPQSGSALSASERKKAFLAERGITDEELLSQLLPLCDYSQCVVELSPSQLANLENVSDYYRVARIDGFFCEEPISESGKKVLIVVLLGLSTLALTLFVKYTKSGKAMRAVSYDIQTSKLMGINVNRVITLTFFIGAFLAGIGGVVYGMRYGKVWPYMGFLPGIKAFVAAVLGGIGSIPGAVIGGLILGFAEIMVQAYGPSDYRDAVAFGILILILIARPRGILGAIEGEKV